jgi:hypothetical protein
MRLLLSLAVFGTLLACKSRRDPPPAEQRAAPPAPIAPPSADPIGPTRVATVAEALRAIISPDDTVIGVGELHERVGHASKRSALGMFIDQALPVFGADTAYLIVETWSPPPACGSAASNVTHNIETAVQRPTSTKSEVRQLADAARVAGITPVAMNFSCEDFALLTTAARKSSDDQIITMLDLTTRELAAQTNAAWRSRAATAARKRIIVYGGGLHNNRQPTAGVEQWSYAATLDAEALAHYVEIDWYPRELAYIDPAVSKTGLLPAPNDHPDDVWVIPQGERSFLLLLPTPGA